VIPGVVHRHLTVGAGPWSVHVVAISLRQRGLSLQAAHAGDSVASRETVRAIAARHTTAHATVVAAINADFFDLKTGEDENNEVIEGRVVRALALTRAPQDSFHHVHSQFAITTKGRAVIEQFVVRDSTAPLRSARFLPDRGALRTLVGGWPRIIVHGRSVADSAYPWEGTPPSFANVRHPRSGVGISRDSNTVYLITVDGRQESSSGMSLHEFADLMLSLGVYEGLNLDGGGSTTMVVNGAVVNSPSDGKERPVGDVLLVVQARPHE
jgi:exopolysaccharide biosynthesis protein